MSWSGLLQGRCLLTAPFSIRHLDVLIGCGESSIVSLDAPMLIDEARSAESNKHRSEKYTTYDGSGIIFIVPDALLLPRSFCFRLVTSFLDDIVVALALARYSDASNVDRFASLQFSRNYGFIRFRQ
jgi:hypothetical protein